MKTSNSPTKKAGKLQRFGSFEEARIAFDQESFEKGFNAERVRQFLEMIQRLRPRRYKPGVYRFRSFEAATRAAIQQSIESIEN